MQPRVKRTGGAVDAIGDKDSSESAAGRVKAPSSSEQRERSILLECGLH
ncbi:hypothetical protein [Pelomonas sp. Root1237]|nr:hypothetical protein [Pelomonas sp. Root1237]